MEYPKQQQSSKSPNRKNLSIYRPPKSDNHKVPVSTFSLEFGILMESVLTSPGHLFIAGDFSVHVDNPDYSDATQLFELYSSMHLVQHIVGPTHDKGHTLDLVLIHEADSFVMTY